MGKIIFLGVALLGLLPAGIFAQGLNGFGRGTVSDEGETKYGYCNMFYVKSSDTAALPFNDLCFVNDVHETAKGYLFMRYVGPVDELQELFVAREWGFYILMPPVKGETRLSIALPGDLGEMEGTPPDGKAFVFLSRNKGPTEYEYQSYYESVDYRAVSGTIKVFPVTIEAGREEWLKEMEYEANLDVMVQPINSDSGTAVAKGDKIRLKATFYIKRQGDD
ncbi:MAG: hypothetical protein H6581_21490 [Bacteroidia bacterium]|nr:hypothetical protein [Bacteroidia bacterium]